jgi:hypothetical protein
MDHMTGSEVLSSPIDVVEEWITYEDENVKASELFPDSVCSRHRFNFFLQCYHRVQLLWGSTPMDPATGVGGLVPQRSEQSKLMDLNYLSFSRQALPPLGETSYQTEPTRCHKMTLARLW